MISKLEPEATKETERNTHVGSKHGDACVLWSIAISLKRIADALEKRP